MQENLSLVVHFGVFCIAITFYYYSIFTLLAVFFAAIIFIRRPSLICICLLGILAMFIDSTTHSQRLIKGNVKNLEIEALLEDISTKDKTIKYSISNVNVLNSRYKIDGKIMAYCKKCDGLNLKPGMVIKAKINAFELPKKVYPTGYDIKNKYKYLGYSGFAFINKIEVLEEKQKLNWLAIPMKIRNYYIQILERKNTDPHTIALLGALFFGDMSQISEKLNDVLRRTGITHVISISGLHISIVMMLISSFIFALLGISKWARYHLPVRKISVVFGSVFCLLYLAVAGMPIAGVRSLVMILFGVAIIMMDLKPRAFSSIIFAGFVVLLIYPHALFFVSFQLSFLAVLALSLTIDDSHSIKNFFLRYAYITIKTSISISIITLPVILYNFGTVSIVGIFYNILIIPYFTFIVMPVGVLYFFLTPLLSHSNNVFIILEKLMFESIAQFLHVSEFFADVQYAFFSLKEMPLVASLTVLAGVLIVLMIKGFFRFFGCVLCIIGMGVYIFSTTPDIVANKEAFVFKNSDGKYYTIEDAPEGFVGSIWRGKLGLKDHFADGSQFCVDGICTTEKFTYLQETAAQEKINAEKCTEILISRIDLKMDELACAYKLIITKKALEGEPYIVLKYETL